MAGLVAGKTGYPACISYAVSGTSPDTSKDYILLTVPIDQGAIEGATEWMESIEHQASGSSYSDRTGEKKHLIYVNRAFITPLVESSALAELNAITEHLEQWSDVGADPIYFFFIINSIQKTWGAAGSAVKYLKCKMRNLRWKMLGPALIECSFTLESCDY